MNAKLEELKHLPLKDRVQLVEELWVSIAADLEATPLSDTLKAAMDRRLEEYLKDPSKSLSLEEVQKRMKDRR